ncbi:nuclear hormone receptor FTZ-F1 [Drosophila tropicalis]|uniref:nuclear hormone receptor FTZ-F1 n=1 Tax=Drosophila tropicalis TaxID=46794 RepID=UPI0035AC06C4
MDSFNVPLLAESSSSSSNNASNYAQQQQQQQQLMPHHHKDQMLAAGNAPTLMPFYQHHQQHQQQHQQQQQHHQKDNVNGTTENFSNSIDGSQLEDGGISLSGLCERMFASPNPHSNSNNNMSLNNNNNNTNNNNVDNKVIATSSTIVVAGGGGGASGGAVGSTSGSAVILESVPMPSFANLLFPQTRQQSQSSTSEALTGIDPALIQKQQLQQQHHQQQQQQQQQQVPSALASTIAIAGPSIEYHQLKPMEVVHTNTNFLTSTTAQLLDFEQPKDDNQITTTTTTAITINATGASAAQLQPPPPPTTASALLATSLPSTTTATTNTANNNLNRSQNQQMRCSLHSIEELAASSCPVAAAPSAAGKARPTTPIAIATATTTTTSAEAGATSSQQQQQQLPQSGSHSIGGGSGGGSGSNLSSDEESMSEDEFGLEIDDQGGYQDTTSSHSQQSGGGGGGANLLNGSSGSGSSTGGGGYMLLPQSNNSSHMGGPQNSTPGNGGGGNSSSNPSAGNGNNGGGGGHHPHGGTSASASGGHGGSSGGHNASGEAIDFKHLFEELCPVCGDKVSGYHYGLLTCESCKGFFKRTVQNKKVYTCVAERSCHIDKTQRKRCPYCRFQKCLEVGMKLEAVRADRMRGGRNKFGPMYKRDRARKLQVMRQRQLALQALRSSMGTDIKPSPLSPGYQQAYPNMNIKQEIQIPQVSSLTQSPDSSPSPIAIALGQVNASTGGGVIATPMNAGNGGGNGNVNGNGGNSLGNGNGSGNNNNNQNTSSTGTGSAGGNGSGGGGGGGSGGNNAGGGGNNSGDGLHRNGSGNGGNGTNCHEAGIGSLQNTAESKLCFDSGTHPSSTADALIEPLRVSPMIREFVQSIDDREWQTQLFALLQKQTYNQVEVDLFELMCKVLDQNLFSQVDWARNTVFFKDLKVDDQMKLLQHSWSDMLVLDHLHHRIHNGLPDETQLNNGQVFNLLSLGLLGVPQLSDYFNELQNKLQDLKFDMGDYVCMKFLILLNPNVRGIVNKKTVSEGHDNVQAALLDYTLTCYPSVNDKFSRLVNILPEIHAMAARGEEHLYSKHCAGSAPTQTLLMEMLHAKRKV